MNYLRGGILIIVLAGGVGQANAGACSTSVSGNGTAKNNELLAKMRAKDSWRTNAASTCGTGYDQWLKSNGKQLACSRSGSFTNRTWTCTAISTPVK